MNSISMLVGRFCVLRVAKCCLIPLKLMSIFASMPVSSWRRISTPPHHGQEIGVIGDVGDEVEHLFRRMADQYGFLDICHKGDSTWQEWEASRPLLQTLSGGALAGPGYPFARRAAKIGILNELGTFHS